ncbi:MAG: cytochrome oxidase Cu insertion factor (SCO1/SenC/PrrC family) [Kiritimatiellia bacterium]|jgi:cytochrome oxidase Cu insertion factor (SCO1/SenC/PrrC family)
MSNEAVVNERKDEKEMKKIVKRNRFFAVMIILIVVAPMGIAYVMYQTGWGVSAGTTNKGTLLSPPVALNELSLVKNTSLLAELFVDKKSVKRWRLLVPVSAGCSEVCQKNLYTTRQVHIRLAEKSYRLERVLLALDTLPLNLQTLLLQKHPNTLLANSTHENFKQWISAAANSSDNAEDYYYLVDQGGLVMMQYDVSHTGQDLLDDVKKLLKFTYDK